MQTRTFVNELLPKLDTASSILLTHNPREEINDEWFERTQELMNLDPLQMRNHRADADWKTIYHLLEPVLGSKNPFTSEVLKNSVAVELLMQAGYDPSQSGNWIVQQAAANGQLSTVRVLLLDTRVDPSAGNNYAIKQASARGHTEIVKLLLADDRVNPSVDNNYPLEMAVDYNHAPVVKLLLESDKLVLEEIQPALISRAYVNNHMDVLRLLLADKRTDKSKISPMILRSVQ